MADNGRTIDWKAYRYDPSLAAAIVFVVLFLLTTFIHLYQLTRTKTWYFIPLCIGGFCKSLLHHSLRSRHESTLTKYATTVQWIGYVGRALSSQESPHWTLGPYIMQTLLLLVAPALFAASIYMELCRIIAVVDGEIHSLIKERWLTKLFVTGDVISFTVQMAGTQFLFYNILRQTVI